MTFSRNWQFTVKENEQAFVIKKVKENEMRNVTFLQLSKKMCLVVMKDKVRPRTVRKLLGVTDILPVSSPKEVRDKMEDVSFSYGSLLNKHQKKLANKASDYSQAVQDFSKTALVPEHDPRFDIVYNIIANADTVDKGKLTVYEDLPLCKHLIDHAVKRFELKKEHNLHLQKMEEGKRIVWKDWQLKLLKELDGKPSERKVIWYYDTVGNTGKTYFSKWRGELDKYTAIVQGGPPKDIYYIIAKRTHDTKTVIIDMARCSKGMLDYNLIENLKNGYFQSGKYDSTMKIMPIPHLVVFANYKPDMEQLSQDRWDIRIISESHPTLFCSPSQTVDIYIPVRCFLHNEHFCCMCCSKHPENKVCECKCTRHKKLNCTMYQCVRETMMNLQ